MLSVIGDWVAYFEGKVACCGGFGWTRGVYLYLFKKLSSFFDD
jgi:hypothetical protein